MKQKILEIISTILNKKIPENAITSIIEKNHDTTFGKSIDIGFAIDIGVLEIAKEEGNDLIAKISKQIKSQDISINKVTIVLTSSKSANNFGQNNSSNNQQNQSQKNNLNQEILPVIGVKKIIAIASAKGGVGKSTIAANLAISLKRIGYNVALVDADIYGPSIPYLLDINDKPEVKNNLIIPSQNFGIKSISIGSLVDSASAGVWRGPMVSKILYQLIRGVNWSFDNKEVDIMIIDMPPGTGDIYLSLAEKFPITGSVIISTPQSLSVIHVIKSVDMFLRLNIKIIGLIQNMAYLKINNQKQYLFGQDGAKKLAKKLALNFLGEIAISQEISDSSENRIPICTTNTNPNITLNFGQIAEKIIDEIGGI
jgi:ATP-binding protein involved in chromosome partitioning